MRNFRKKTFIGILFTALVLAAVFSVLPGAVFAASLAEVPEEEVTDGQAVFHFEEDQNPQESPVVHEEKVAPEKAAPEKPIPENGRYFLNVELWKEDLSGKSAYDLIFQNNRKALVEVADGCVTKVILAFNPARIPEATDSAPIIGENLSAEKEAAIVSFLLAGESPETQKTAAVLLQPDGTEQTCLVKAVYKIKAALSEAADDAILLPMQFVVSGEKPQDAYIKLLINDPESAEDGKLKADTHMADASGQMYLTTALTVAPLQTGEAQKISARVEPLRIEDLALNAEAVVGENPLDDPINSEDVQKLQESDLLHVPPEDYQIQYTSADPSVAKVTENDDNPLPQEEGEISLQEEEAYDDLFDIGDELVEYEDNRTGIQVQYQDGSINPESEDMDIAVMTLTSGASYNAAASNEKVQGRKFAVYSIRLADGATVITPNSRFLIFIPIPQGWDGTKMIAYQIADGGSLLPLQGDLEDNSFVFTASSWGNFAIVEDAVAHNGAVPDGDDSGDAEYTPATPVAGANLGTTSPTTTGITTPNARTGDTSNVTLWIIIAVAAVTAAVVALVFLRKNR